MTVKESETCPVIPLIVGRRISNWSRQDAARSVSVVRIIVIMLGRWERRGTTENGSKLLGGWRTSARMERPILRQVIHSAARHQIVHL